MESVCEGSVQLLKQTRSDFIVHIGVFSVDFRREELEILAAELHLDFVAECFSKDSKNAQQPQCASLKDRHHNRKKMLKAVSELSKVWDSEGLPVKILVSRKQTSNNGQSQTSRNTCTRNSKSPVDIIAVVASRQQAVEIGFFCVQGTQTVLGLAKIQEVYNRLRGCRLSTKLFRRRVEVVVPVAALQRNVFVRPHELHDTTPPSSTCASSTSSGGDANTGGHTAAPPDEHSENQHRRSTTCDTRASSTHSAAHSERRETHFHSADGSSRISVGDEKGVIVADVEKEMNRDSSDRSTPLHEPSLRLAQLEEQHRSEKFSVSHPVSCGTLDSRYSPHATLRHNAAGVASERNSSWTTAPADQDARRQSRHNFRGEVSQQNLLPRTTNVESLFEYWLEVESKSGALEPNEWFCVSDEETGEAIGLRRFQMDLWGKRLQDCTVFANNVVAPISFSSISANKSLLAQTSANFKSQKQSTKHVHNNSKTHYESCGLAPPAMSLRHGLRWTLDGKRVQTETFQRFYGNRTNSAFFSAAPGPHGRRGAAADGNQEEVPVVVYSLSFSLAMKMKLGTLSGRRVAPEKQNKVNRRKNLASTAAGPSCMGSTSNVTTSCSSKIRTGVLGSLEEWKRHNQRTSAVSVKNTFYDFHDATCYNNPSDHGMETALVDVERPNFRAAAANRSCSTPARFVYKESMFAANGESDRDPLCVWFQQQTSFLAVRTVLLSSRKVFYEYPPPQIAFDRTTGFKQWVHSHIHFILFVVKVLQMPELFLLLWKAGFQPVANLTFPSISNAAKAWKEACAELLLLQKDRKSCIDICEQNSPARARKDDGKSSCPNKTGCWNKEKQVTEESSLQSRILAVQKRMRSQGLEPINREFWWNMDAQMITGVLHVTHAPHLLRSGYCQEGEITECNSSVLSEEDHELLEEDNLGPTTAAPSNCEDIESSGVENKRVVLERDDDFEPVDGRDEGDMLIQTTTSESTFTFGGALHRRRSRKSSCDLHHAVHADGHLSDDAGDADASGAAPGIMRTRSSPPSEERRTRQEVGKDDLGTNMPTPNGAYYAGRSSAGEKRDRIELRYTNGNHVKNGQHRNLSTSTSGNDDAGAPSGHRGARSRCSKPRGQEQEGQASQQVVDGTTTRKHRSSQRPAQPLLERHAIVTDVAQATHSRLLRGIPEHVSVRFILRKVGEGLEAVHKAYADLKTHNAMYVPLVDDEDDDGNTSADKSPRGQQSGGASQQPAKPAGPTTAQITSFREKGFHEGVEIEYHRRREAGRAGLLCTKKEIADSFSVFMDEFGNIYYICGKNFYSNNPFLGGLSKMGFLSC
ncbi:unnamed protein product [Amoebophrya sp. A120]|nr:unnamed protein product [Amoebophrya sp. A120]|eukprot:GSA120T00004163001.1